MLAYDKAVEATKDSDAGLEFDLSKEKQKQAQKYAKAGVRKAPTVYNFAQKQRKPNATKGGLIAELAEFLRTGSQFDVSNLEIANSERMIVFSVGEDKYDLTLIQKRKPKK